MKPIFIAFGANLSNPKQTFSKAQADLRSRGVDILMMSGLWQSPAWPLNSGAPDYLNAVASVRYDGDPEDLMRLLLEIETAHGRKRSVRNAPRILDLDLLVWGDLRLNTAHLTLPHPRMFTRPFVLLPLDEIVPNWRDPWQRLTAMEHLARCEWEDVAALKRVSEA